MDQKSAKGIDTTDTDHREIGEGLLEDEMAPSSSMAQLDYQGETLQREEATFLDAHPLNVFDRRIDDLVAILDALTWENGDPFSDRLK